MKSCIEVARLGTSTVQDRWATSREGSGHAVVALDMACGRQGRRSGLVMAVIIV